MPCGSSAQAHIPKTKSFALSTMTSQNGDNIFSALKLSADAATFSALSKNTILTRLLWQCRRQVSVCAAKFWISARTPRAGLKRFRVFFSLQTARSASIKSAMLKLRIFSGASRFALTLPIFAAMSEAEWSLLRAEAAQSEANCAGSLPRIIPKR